MNRTSPSVLISPDDFNNFVVKSVEALLRDVPASFVDPTDHGLPSGCSMELWRAVSVKDIVEIVNSFFQLY